jgi:hypothetical protein
MYPNIHRHPNGSIDFEFYRRTASRRRQLARRVVFRRLVWLANRLAISFCRAVSRAAMGVWNTPAIQLSDRLR